VRLAVRRAEGGIAIDVTDPGREAGLAAAPAEGNVPGVERGHGLRFSLAKALTKLHGGRLIVSDDDRGGHTTTVILPDA
jgi:signal transduction histidine kinase